MTSSIIPRCAGSISARNSGSEREPDRESLCSNNKQATIRGKSARMHWLLKILTFQYINDLYRNAVYNGIGII